jgi:hypothetical protein
LNDAWATILVDGRGVAVHAQPGLNEVADGLVWADAVATTGGGADAGGQAE